MNTQEKIREEIIGEMRSLRERRSQAGNRRRIVSVSAVITTLVIAAGCVTSGLYAVSVNNDEVLAGDDNIEVVTAGWKYRSIYTENVIEEAAEAAEAAASLSVEEVESSENAASHESAESSESTGSYENVESYETVGGSENTIDGMSYSRRIDMTATAYSTAPEENGGYSVSAMGGPLGYGVVAVDPNVIPLGSTVYVTAPDGSWSYGVASAEDTGGAIKGNRIDLCYESAGEVDRFGRRGCVVYVLN